MNKQLTDMIELELWRQGAHFEVSQDKIKALIPKMKENVNGQLLADGYSNDVFVDLSYDGKCEFAEQFVNQWFMNMIKSAIKIKG